MDFAVKIQIHIYSKEKRMTERQPARLFLCNLTSQLFERATYMEGRARSFSNEITAGACPQTQLPTPDPKTTHALSSVQYKMAHHSLYLVC